MTPIEIDMVINASQAANTLKDTKKALKEIQSAMLAVGDEGSADFNRLAQAAAQLEDRVGEVKDRIGAMNPDGFKSLTNFASKAGAAVSAVTGAMALFGSENEDVQKSLMKVQAAMALAQGLEGMSGMTDAVKDLKAGLKALWKSMLANPVLAIVSVLAILATTAYAVYKAFTEVSDETKELTREYEKQKEVTATLSREYDRQIELLQAQGASEAEVIEVKKKLIEAQILEAETSLRLHASKVKDISDNDSLYESYLRVQSSVSGFLGFTEAEQVQLDLVAKNKAERAEEEIKGAKKDLETLKDLKNQLLVIDAEAETKQREAAKVNRADQEKLDADSEQNKLKNHAAYLAAKRKMEQDEHDRRKQEFQDEQAELQANTDMWNAMLAEIDAGNEALSEATTKRLDNERKQRQMVMNAALDGASSLFGSLSQLAGKNAKLQKGFAIGEATINTFKGVTNALAQPLPVPVNFITAAAVLAAGIKSVQNIMKQDTNGGGSGGGSLSGGSALGASGGVSLINSEPAQPQQPTTQLGATSTSGQSQQGNVVLVVEDYKEKATRVQVAESAVAFR